MKTTVDMPDELFHQLKSLARERQVTMRELIIDGLRSEISLRQAPAPRVDFQFRTADGNGLAPGISAEDALRLGYDLPA